MTDEIITDNLILRSSDDDRDLSNYLSHLKSADEFYIQYGYDYSPELEAIIDFHTAPVYYYTLFLKDNGKMVGYVGLTNNAYGEIDTGEIEFYIFKEHRRNHYC